MGNFTSCFCVKPHKAKLIDLRGNFRLVDIPITTAELMLEQPGYVLSAAGDLWRNSRLSALGADEELCAGKDYLLIPVNRVNTILSESDMAVIMLACGKRTVKRRSRKVLPTQTSDSDGSVNFPVTGDDMGLASYRLKQWKPALDPIYEV